MEDGKQVTKFKEGILPWSLQNPVALVFDEYDAGRPDVMFVIQRVLEVEGKLTLLDQNKVLKFSILDSGYLQQPIQLAWGIFLVSIIARSKLIKVIKWIDYGILN